MQTIYDKLREYSRSDDYPFHMPGHKRRLGALPEVRDMDITEIEGFDNLHHATGIIRQAQQRAAQLYGSEETYYLVNGSTAGILAAISACTTYGGKILMARNSHKAAYHAVQIRGLQAVYLYPQGEGTFASKTKSYEASGNEANGNGASDYKAYSCEAMRSSVIMPQDVECALSKDPEIQAVYITSPTYEGTVSDVKAIAQIAHKYGKPLIVDEAHGAHFGFHPYFPENSVKAGADLVIHSVHKTLPSLTQTALLHRNGELTDLAKVKEYLDIYQTSSPSYLLMASIDECVKMMAEETESLFATFVERLQEFYSRSESLQILYVWKTFPKPYRDPSKIVVSAGEKGGKWLGEKLRKEYHIQVEMELADYVVMIATVADTQEGFDRLWKALEEIDGQLTKNNGAAVKDGVRSHVRTGDRTDKKAGDHMDVTEGHSRKDIRPKAVMTIARATDIPHEQVRLADSEGRISGEYIYLYPPGIPMIVPGEKINKTILEICAKCLQKGYDLQGLKDYEGTYIGVCKNSEPARSTCC